MIQTWRLLKRRENKKGESERRSKTEHLDLPRSFPNKTDWMSSHLPSGSLEKIGKKRGEKRNCRISVHRALGKSPAQLLMRRIWGREGVVGANLLEEKARRWGNRGKSFLLVQTNSQKLSGNQVCEGRERVLPPETAERIHEPRDKETKIEV